jgi:hypothetical protein|tara:strand:+ start:1067 stop:1348 length:282 start_codon:yes stop_codon:yes gene_type:complete
MSFPPIKEASLCAVVEKSTQVDPLEYCGNFLVDNAVTGENLMTLAVVLAKQISGDDLEEGVMVSTLVSAAMFMTYEMARAEVEGQELEALFND